MTGRHEERGRGVSGTAHWYGTVRVYNSRYLQKEIILYNMYLHVYSTRQKNVTIPLKLIAV